MPSSAVVRPALAGLFCLSIAFAQSPPDVVMRCESLAGERIDSGTITQAEHFAKGQKLSGWMSDVASTGVCRARLRLQPTAASDIKAEVWLPDNWNGKLLTHGGGGFSGGLAAGAGIMNDSAGRGYASATSDLGHPVSATGRWAHLQPDKVIDFAHRANHVLALAAKQTIETFYGTAAQRAYFQGCSGGGREALSEVMRYPSDYDGVIAGAPAMNFSEIMTQILWNEQVMAAAPRLNTKLAALGRAVLRACDGLDGVSDGVIENPLQCRFDPIQLQCKVFDTAACLTIAEVDVLRKLYTGPRLKSGEHLISGPALGSEGVGWLLAGFMNSVGGPEFYRWLVHDEPSWKSSSFDLERDYALARGGAGALVNADNPDIGKFLDRGGKLILYHGWADGLISPHNTLRYFDKIRRQMGFKVKNGARLFMVPGLQHCGDGVDLLPQLEDWVERGRAPERAIARPTPEASRLLCPWPQTARHKGSGAKTDAASFECI